jgi:hypothetical protein
VVQGVGPEFKPQYHKKRKKIKIANFFVARSPSPALFFFVAITTT